MAIAVDRERVKARCQITGTAHDAAIDALIAEMVPAISVELSAEALASADAQIAATLNLGATEIVAGEYLAWTMVAVGAMDTVSVDGFELRPASLNPADPFGLKAQGYARLTPFRAKASGVIASGIYATVGAP
ncbi:MAG: hypothetical protein SFX74_03120 [Fimbriimonadaceae bacterium]|nr:hypothetical protein [Fimbriimonadaceae bacterium]